MFDNLIDLDNDMALLDREIKDVKCNNEQTLADVFPNPVTPSEKKCNYDNIDAPWAAHFTRKFEERK